MESHQNLNTQQNPQKQIKINKDKLMTQKQKVQGVSQYYISQSHDSMVFQVHQDQQTIKARQLMRNDSELMRRYFKSLQDTVDGDLEQTKFTPAQAFFKILLPDFLYYIAYPKSLKLDEQQLLYDENVYLAQDRTLCMGIHQNGYTLDYIPDAHAWVDPIKTLHGLLGQRKRWINGSFFAFQKVKQQLNKGKTDDFFLKLQIFYLTLMNMMAFVSPALFLYTIHIVMFAIRDWFFGVVLGGGNISTFKTTQFYNSFVFIFDFIYVLLVLGFIFKSIHFTHRNQKFIPYIYMISTVMGIWALVIFIILVYDMIVGIADTVRCYNNPDQFCSITFLAELPALRNQFFNRLPGGLTLFFFYKWLVVSILAMYIIPILFYSMLYCKFNFLVDLILGVFSFTFYTPTYLNILNTFALCRIDDISWGTKGLDIGQSKNKALLESWKSIKLIHVGKFIFWNVVVGAILLVVGSPISPDGIITQQQYDSFLVQSYVRKFLLTVVLMLIIGFSLLLKIILGSFYIIRVRCFAARPDQSILRTKRNFMENVQQNFLSIKQSLYRMLRRNINEMTNQYVEQNVQSKINLSLSYLLAYVKKFTPEHIRMQQKQEYEMSYKQRIGLDKRTLVTSPRRTFRKSQIIKKDSIFAKIIKNAKQTPKIINQLHSKLPDPEQSFKSIVEQAKLSNPNLNLPINNNNNALKLNLLGNDGTRYPEDLRKVSSDRVSSIEQFRSEREPQIKRTFQRQEPEEQQDIDNSSKNLITHTFKKIELQDGRAGPIRNFQVNNNVNGGNSGSSSNSNSSGGQINSSGNNSNSNGNIGSYNSNSSINQNLNGNLNVQSNGSISNTVSNNNNVGNERSSVIAKKRKNIGLF